MKYINAVGLEVKWYGFFSTDENSEYVGKRMDAELEAKQKYGEVKRKFKKRKDDGKQPK